MLLPQYNNDVFKLNVKTQDEINNLCILSHTTTLHYVVQFKF
jgi:hypothetical protein